MRRDAEVHSITSAQPGPSAEFVHRERQYLFLMGTRMVAIVAAVVLPGFWRWIAVAAGIVLPYVAVVLVNAVKVRGTPDDPYFLEPPRKFAIADSPDAGISIASRSPGAGTQGPDHG